MCFRKKIIKPQLYFVFTPSIDTGRNSQVRRWFKTGKPPNVGNVWESRQYNSHICCRFYTETYATVLVRKKILCASLSPRKNKMNYLLKQGYAKYLKIFKQDIWRKEGTFVVNQNARFTNTLNFIQRWNFIVENASIYLFIFFLPQIHLKNIFLIVVKYI